MQELADVAAMRKVLDEHLAPLIPEDCAVSDWGAFGACSKDCGGGTQTRSREVTTPARSTGTACPVLQETQDCNTDACTTYSVWPNAYSVWPNHASATKVGANGIPLSWCTERQNLPFNQGGPSVKGGNFGGGKATWCIAEATKVGANGIPLSWCTERQNKPFNQGGPRVKGGNFGGSKATWCIAGT